MRKLICVCFVIAGGLSSLWAQPPGDLWTQKEEAFVVKQYDEFIERFNFDRKARILKHLKDEGVNVENPNVMNRSIMIRSLFNLEDNGWDTQLMDSFIAEINNSDSPVLLDFYDDDWYIELGCIFEYEGEHKPGSIILKLLPYNDNSSEWQIVSVITDFLPGGSECKPVLEKRDPRKLIHPMSHETQFAGLRTLFEDRENLVNFFTNEEWSEDMNLFFHEMKRGRLCLEKTTGMTYHLLQFDNWVVTLKRYNRLIPNAGLLISSLSRSGKNQKSRYIYKQLNIN